jgi:DNA (cytosine-5)-methyltransferase 3A
MKVVSLFDGISVAHQSLKDRITEYYASEIDKYAIKVSHKNYPDIKRLGDVRTVEFIPDIDLLIGGSPCTDLSIAKKDRKGLEGEHSSLFWEYVRVLKLLNPKYFILENVNSMPKADRDIITKELGVEPIMINASLVSAQSRKRLFWTNIPVKGLPADRGIVLKDILEKDIETKTIESPMVAIKKENKEFNQVGYFGDKNACGVGGQALRVYDTEKKSPTSGVGLFQIGYIGNTNSQGNRVYDPDGKSVCLSANGGGRGAKTGLYQVVENNEAKRIRKLTPIECERLQSLPDNYTFGISNTQRYRCLGNAFNCEVIRFITSFIV